MLMAAVAVAGVSCSPQKQPQAVAVKPAGSTGQVAYLPQAIAYRTSAPAADYVPVNVNPEGNAIVSYPAPGDITDNSRPLKLDDGWWLDRRGISPLSAFTTYTYAEYAKLPSAPSAEQLLGSIQPGIHVTEMISLPMKVGQATVATANEAIKSGNYKVVYQRK